MSVPDHLEKFLTSEAAAAAAAVHLATLDPDSLLTRKGAAAALTAAGFPTSPATLATKASRGGGPRYRKWSTRPLYRWGDCLAWARDSLGPPISSTSEADALGHRDHAEQAIGAQENRRSRTDGGENATPPPAPPRRGLRRGEFRPDKTRGESGKIDPADGGSLAKGTPR